MGVTSQNMSFWGVFVCVCVACVKIKRSVYISFCMKNRRKIMIKDLWPWMSQFSIKRPRWKSISTVYNNCQNNGKHFQSHNRRAISDYFFHWHTSSYMPNLSRFSSGITWESFFSFRIHLITLLQSLQTSYWISILYPNISDLCNISDPYLQLEENVLYKKLFLLCILRSGNLMVVFVIS